MRYNVLVLTFMLAAVNLWVGCGDPKGMTVNPIPPADLRPAIDPTCIPLIDNFTKCNTAIKDHEGLFSCDIDPKLFQRCALICTSDLCQGDSAQNMQGRYQQTPEKIGGQAPLDILISLSPDNKNITISGSSKLVEKDSPGRPVKLPAMVYGSSRDPNIFTIYRYTQKVACDFEVMVISGTVPAKGMVPSCMQLVGVNVRFLRFKRCSSDAQPLGVEIDERIYRWNRVLDPDYPPSCSL